MSKLLKERSPQITGLMTESESVCLSTAGMKLKVRNSAGNWTVTPDCVFPPFWQTRKIKSVFRLQDHNALLRIWFIKASVCSWGKTYIGEKARNFEVRLKEHKDINRQSEPPKYMKNTQIMHSRGMYWPQLIYRWNEGPLKRSTWHVSIQNLTISIVGRETSWFVRFTYQIISVNTISRETTNI